MVIVVDGFDVLIVDDDVINVVDCDVDVDDVVVDFDVNQYVGDDIICKVLDVEEGQWSW